MHDQLAYRPFLLLEGKHEHDGDGDYKEADKQKDWNKVGFWRGYLNGWKLRHLWHLRSLRHLHLWHLRRLHLGHTRHVRHLRRLRHLWHLRRLRHLQIR